MGRQTVRWLNVGIAAASAVGFAVSYYAYVVETAKERDKSYEALCDISEHVSCTKAFTSKYGKGFGIIPKTSALYMPNSVYGMAFYALLILLSASNKYPATLASILLGNASILMSMYLAYILYLLNDICVVCVTTYVMNAIIVTLAVKKYRLLFSSVWRQKRKVK